MAKDARMDLVEVSPNAEPPVCKIMDFGKFLYEQKKQLSDQKRKQKKNTVKTIKYRPGTEEGDYQIKFRNLVKFLENGDKVKVSIWFRGREMQHRELGMEMLDRIEKDTEEFANVEQKAKMEGRQLGMMLAPKSKKKYRNIKLGLVVQPCRIQIHCLRLDTLPNLRFIVSFNITNYS